MNTLNNIVRFLKGIYILPNNISSIQNELNRVGNELDLLNKRLDNLELEHSYEKKIHVTSCQNPNERKQFIVSTTINDMFEKYFLQTEALISIYNSLPNLIYLPNTRGWAGSPDFLNKIIELIFKEKPKFVLEAGSGVSSIIIGLALQINKIGTSISLDHELSYCETSTRNIQMNGIDKISLVKYEPLIEYDNFDEHFKWYDIKNLNLTEKIDMLIIDGPPRVTQFLARFPAIPILYKYFGDRTIIILDDSNRKDEEITINRWITFLENNKFRVSIVKFNNFEKGMTILEVFRIID